MTMRDLARLANVSISTVSKAFHSAEYISEETRQQIFAIAKEHGCFGKFYKERFHKKIIAIICPELSGSYYSGYVERLQKIIEDNDGIALISTDHFRRGVQAELIDYYASYLRVDGIFVVGLEDSPKRGYEIPIVSLLSSSSSFDSVVFDMDSAIREAVQALRSLGHEKIAFIGEPLTRYKARIFAQAMGIDASSSCIIESSYRFEKAGEDGVMELLRRDTDSTAIICAYDNIAFGVIRQLKKHGYQVPQDFSVVGIDNISTSEYTETPLTTIDTQPDDICMIAWDLMCKKQESKYYRSNRKSPFSADSSSGNLSHQTENKKQNKPSSACSVFGKQRIGCSIQSYSRWYYGTYYKQHYSAWKLSRSSLLFPRKSRAGVLPLCAGSAPAIRNCGSSAGDRRSPAGQQH